MSVCSMALMLRVGDESAGIWWREGGEREAGGHIKSSWHYTWNNKERKVINDFDRYKTDSPVYKCT